jgi:hypothetical protein
VIGAVFGQHRVSGAADRLPAGPAAPPPGPRNSLARGEKHGSRRRFDKPPDGLFKSVNNNNADIKMGENKP